MTHYEKIAVIVFRVIAVVIFLVGISFLIFTLLLTYSTNSLKFIVIASLPYLIGGALLFFVSKFLAKIVCSDLGLMEDE